MNKPLSIALLLIGILLLVYGSQASDSVSSGVSRVFTGSPTDKTIWLFIGGTLCTVLGLVGVMRSGRE